MEGGDVGGSALLTDMLISKSGRRKEESIRGVRRRFLSSIEPFLPVLSSFQVALRRSRSASRYQKVSRIARSVSGELLVVETTNWRLFAGLREGIGACGFER